MKALLEKTLPYFCKDPSDLEQRRITTVFLTSLFSYIVISAAFGVANILRGDLLFGWTPIIGVAVVVLIAFPLLAITKNHIPAGYIASSVMSLFTLFWLAYDAENRGAYLWTYGIVPCIFFILGRRHGLVFMGINLFLIAWILFWPDNLVLHADYSVPWKMRYIGSWSILLVIVYLFESSRAKAQSALQAENKRRKLIQRDLEVARQKAEAASEAKSLFLAHMSHELRTPLGGVIGMIGLMLESELSENQRGYARSAQRNAELLLTVINDILDFSKIEAGQMEFESVDFDLLFVLDQVFDAVSLRAAKKRIELNALIEPDVPLDLLGDPLRLKQVLINLVGNGIKFTDEGEVWVEVNLVEKKDGKATLRFEVHDTGIGIEPEKIARLFKSFSQADQSVSRKYGGTGLGLAISKAIVDAMDGQVGVASLESRGSVFWFTVGLECGTVTLKNLSIDRDGEKPRVIIASPNAHTVFACQQRLAPSCEINVGGESIEEVESFIDQTALETSLYTHIVLDEKLIGANSGNLERLRRRFPQEEKPFFVGLYPYDGLPTKSQARQLGLDKVVAKPPKMYELLRALLVEDDSLGAHEDGGLWGRRQVRRQGEIHVPEALRGRRVIIAEDNETLLEIAQRILEKFGLEVTCVDNGHTLLERLEWEEFELVLTDIQMPVVDGIDAVRIIRDPLSNVLNHRIPVVALSAHVIGSDKESYLANGFSDYLHKPLSPGDLLGVLCRHLKVESVSTTTEEGKKKLSQQFEQPAFDVAGLLERYGDEEELCRELVADFIETVPGRIEQIMELLRHGDTKTLKIVVHGLKGVALTFAADRMADACAEIEWAIARQDRVDDVVDRLFCEKEDYEKAASAWLQESRRKLISPRKSSRFSSNTI